MESGAEKKTLTSSYLTLTIGGFLKKEIDAYVEYAVKVGGQKIDPIEARHRSAAIMREGVNTEKMNERKRDVALTIFTILFGLLAISNFLKPLERSLS